MAIDFKNIKLIIWDLDETLWHGILSEGEVHMPDKNRELIKMLVDNGVMCSICSKNDEEETKKALTEYDIWDMFVFNSINWTSKGERVSQIIKEMQLRAVNVLFIDDNHLNREEVKHICEGIMVSDVDVIPLLYDYYSNTNKKDIEHKRLEQYKVLEKKKQFSAVFGSNEEFLMNSNIEVTIHKDCETHLDRLADLVLRSNQLNFTKVRSSKDELKKIIEDASIDTGYVTVKDNFGDYGIIGFYALKGNRLIHFVFSCRTLNMGIEQYIYKQLKQPDIEVVGDVSSSLDNPNPYWINNKTSTNHADSKRIINETILFKGPCDIDQIFSYIQTGNNIIKEFTYISDRGVSIEGRNHTSHIIQAGKLDEKTKTRIINNLPFGDKDMYETRLFDKDVKYVVLSLFTDPNLGMYREKESGAVVAFMEYTSDLTDESKWDKYINKEVFVAECSFKQEDLEYIKDKYTFIGRLSPNDIMNNLKIIRNRMNDDSTLILCLGSETPYLNNKQESYVDRHLFNAELNKMVKEWAKENENIKVLDFNNYITGQESFTDNINHFNRTVYYKMAQEIIEFFRDQGGMFEEKNAIVVNVIKDINLIFRPIISRVKRIIRKIS